jgi:hypothetical protein
MQQLSQFEEFMQWDCHHEEFMQQLSQFEEFMQWDCHHSKSACSGTVVNQKVHVLGLPTLKEGMQ